MIFRWLRQRRRRKLLATPLPTPWTEWLEKLDFYSTLSPDERERLAAIARVMVAEKNWQGCGGLDLTEEMELGIAAQAALLLLNLDHDHFRNVRSIMVYPSTFVAPHQRGSGGGGVSEGSVSLGEAWYRGPVVLSWDAAQLGGRNMSDGRNVVLHEFAHKLDFLDGRGDGTPQLESADAYDAWKRVMTEKYEGLVEASRERKATLLDKYGTTNPAEFFAVVTECFFEKSRQLENRHPDLYDLLRDFYRQDPARRLEDLDG